MLTPDKCRNVIFLSNALSRKNYAAALAMTGARASGLLIERQTGDESKEGLRSFSLTGKTGKL
jgi:hypothetical protein